MGFLDWLKQTQLAEQGQENMSGWGDLIQQTLGNQSAKAQRTMYSAKRSLGDTWDNATTTSVSGQRDPEMLEREQEEMRRKLVEAGWEVGGGTAYAQEPIQETMPSETEPPQTTESQKDPKVTWAEGEAVKEIEPTIVEYAENKLFKESDKWNLPRPLALSQWAVEGGRDLNDSQPNSFGLLIQDENGNAVLADYGGYDKQVKAYAQTVASIASTNMGKPINVADDNAVKEFLGSHDVEDILYHLQLQSNGEPGIQRYEDSLVDENGNLSPQLYIDMIHNMPEWRHYR